jgi:hypothetical protein
MRRSLLAGAVLLAACAGSTLDPLPESWVEEPHLYVLRTVDGAPLPAVAGSGPGGVFTVRADSLRLEPDGRGVQVTRMLVDLVDGEPTEERWETRFTYVLRGHRLELSVVCPPEPISSCTAPPHDRGTLTDDGLRLEPSMGYEGPRSYARVAPGA